MMADGKLFFALCAIISIGKSDKLPDYFTKCKITDGQCLLKNAVDNLPKIAENGDKDFQIKTLKPFFVKALTVQATPSLKVVLHDAHIGDFHTIQMKEIKIDPANEKFSLNAHWINFELMSKYSMNGQILILPIVGEGNINLTSINFDTKFTAKLNTVEKEGNSYYKLSDSNITSSKPQRVFYDLTNLFNGDVALGKEMNIFLNENWFEVYGEVENAIFATVGMIIMNVINGYFSKIPLDELFIK